jgi:CHASE2 domain-containing sensor protein/nitrogen-specific signal transduction histidine kinase
MFAAPALRRAARTEWWVLTALLSLLCLVLGAMNGLGRPDNAVYDLLLSKANRAKPADIVIIAIDDASLAILGRWPWPRQVLALGLDKLADAKPRAVGLDLILSEPDATNDATLARAIARLPAVLPVFPESRIESGERHLRPVLPMPELARAAKRLGHISIEVDGDGIARSVFLRQGEFRPPPETRTWPQFALAMLALADPAWNSVALPGERNPAPAQAGRWARDYWVRMPFAGPGGSIERIPFAELAAGRIDAARLTDKYVLVGATASGLGDAYPTPVSGHSALMPGVEIHANLLDALRLGATITVARPWQNALVNLLPLLLLLLALPRLSPRSSLALTAGLLLTMPLLAWLALTHGTCFAPMAGLICVAAAYPLWSWRRLEATMRYLGEEFRRLAAEPRVLPAVPEGASHGGDLVETRILAVAGAADRLRQVSRFVADTIQSLPNAALVVDADGRVLIANRVAARHFTAASSAELRGKPVTELVTTLQGRGDEPGPDWPAIAALAMPVDGDDDRASRTIECRTTAGLHLVVRCARLGEAEGGTGGWIVGFSDITDLRQAEQAREEVLAFLSHDMRSPQSSIIALLELHELDPEDNPKEEVHRRIEQYARRTLSLSEQFLQLARAEKKAHEPTIEDLGVLAEEAVDEVWTAAGQKSIGIDLKWDGEPLPVLADRTLLSRAIINLLTNAVKYSPENTVVTITVTERDFEGRASPVCEVADRGYGISAENLAKLFERYRRFSEPGQPKAQGAGLGMAFVKTVIEKHGGSIGVQSEPGKGSVFTLRLPSFAETAPDGTS